ncbi:MAG: iron-siderophore ABC transporter substrate-binding protein [Actinomycetota bacterium]|nr:iron-siderophore ABC transporter substrate-binding protein [Actinomycetota bacterium]
MQTRWLALAAALLALGATACGAKEGDGATAGQTDPEVAAPPRMIEHAMGTTQVTGRPQRVVVLDTGELDTAVSLGVTPVGAVEAITGDGLPDYLADRVRDVDLVGTIEQPNLETIAALQPDLILSNKLRHEAIYDQLSQVAPTVFAEETGVTWKENFDLYARALGRIDQARQLEQRYDRDIAAFKAAMGERLAETEISVVRSVGDEVRLYANENFIGTILEDTGLARPQAQDKDTFSITATPENIEALDGDVMFLSRFGDEHPILQGLMEDPRWDRLQAVRQGDVHEVPDDLWFLGIGYLAADLILEDLHQVLVEGRPLR